VKELIEYIALSLVDDPSQVIVSQFRNGGRENLELHVAKEDMGRVIGFVFGVMSGSQEARVLMLAVDRRYRAMGLGTLLTHEFFRECGKRGIRQVSLEVRVSNQAALRFYQRLGFFNVRMATHYYSDGEDGIFLLRYL